MTPSAPITMPAIAPPLRDEDDDPVSEVEVELADEVGRAVCEVPWLAALSLFPPLPPLRVPEGPKTSLDVVYVIRAVDTSNIVEVSPSVPVVTLVSVMVLYDVLGRLKLSVFVHITEYRILGEQQSCFQALTPRIQF